MKKYILAVVVFVLCANFSEQTSVRKEHPDVNFSGTITTQAGETMKAENITIGGKYEAITAYSKPGEHIDPKRGTVKLDLAEIKEIRLQEPSKSLFIYKHPAESYIGSDGIKRTRSPKTAQYITFEVLYKNMGPKYIKTYVIERDKKIWFDEIIGANRVQHHANFESIKLININKATSAKEQNVYTTVHSDNMTTTTDSKNIDHINNTVSQLEDTVASISQDSSMSIEHWKNKLIKLLKELCDALAKLLR